ncbi:natriuretic peptide A-like [Sparus aurata]|uniref:Natriuretic peptide A-like n=1 Tax=Sparus aurata TaxID=8175 RepID=A0A671WVJ9_SPAAU|nr:C-type natriuretic peptide 3-like [Sparus aurata]
MNANISVCCLSLLLLLHFVRAKPLSDLQSLKQLLEEFNTAPYYPSSEEMEVKRDRSVFGAPEQEPWSSSDRSSPSDPPAAKENVLASLFRDLMRTSKRSWSRYKKGGLRSCFGVRLERIGSFSGLGC